MKMQSGVIPMIKKKIKEKWQPVGLHRGLLWEYKKMGTLEIASTQDYRESVETCRENKSNQ